MNTYLIIGIVLGIVVLFVWYCFNALTHARQTVSEGWAGIDVQLKRRQDLIPNLVDTAKGYATHEEKIFTDIATLRAQALSGNTEDLSQRGMTEKALGENIKTLLALSEAYPELKANQNFLKLQEELSETEDQIASSRRIYNANVTYYNTKVSTFPNMLVAALFGFKLAAFFENE